MCVNNEISHFILHGVLLCRKKGTNCLNTIVDDICKGKRRYTSFSIYKNRSH